MNNENQNDDTDDTIVEGDDYVVSMGNVEALAYEVYPKGDYDIVIAKCDFGMSQNSGKPMWTMHLEITDGDYTGKKIVTFVSFSEKALPGTKTAMKVFAPEYADVDFSPKAIAAKGELLGRRLRIRVAIGEYQGEKRNQVKKWLVAQKENEFIA